MPERFEDPYYLSCLQEMGLTHHEALVYSALLSIGPSHAKKIGEVAHLAREHSYEILRKLEAKGLVELVLAKSSWYIAVEPKLAVNSFVAKISDQSRLLTEKAYEMGAWLQQLKQDSLRRSEDVVHSEPHMRLVFGRNVMQEFERELKSTKSEYLGVFGHSGTLAARRTLELLAGAARRGVNVRVITDLPAFPDRHTRRLPRAFDVRAHESAGIGARFSVFDGSAAILALHEPVTTGEDARAICSYNPTFVRGFVLHFEQLWGASRPLVYPETKAPIRVSKG